MAKFRVEGKMEIYFTTEVEADSYDEAEACEFGLEEYANDTFAIIGNYPTTIHVSGYDVEADGVIEIAD